MSVAETVCRQCGWHNEPGARMCGGCGRPLRANVPAGRVASAVYAFEPDVPDDSPTVPDLPIVRPQPVRPGSYRSSGSPPGSAPARPRRGAGRVLTVLLALPLVLFACGAGVWAAAVRPALHQQVDSAIRAQMHSLVAGFNAQAIVPTEADYQVADAQQATNSIAQDVTSSTPLRNVQIHFTGGRAVIGYTVYGTDGSVSTSLNTANGRLYVSQTRVDGLLSLIESGDELQAAMNDELAKLRTDVKITKVTLDNDKMFISVTGNTTLHV